MPNKNIHVHVVCDPTMPLCAALIQLGIEEEGVPSSLTMHSIPDAVEAAKNAADTSRLMVGVAINGIQMVIHHQKLPQAQPILMYGQNMQLARLVGKNAARLVKGLPFDLTGANIGETL